MRACTTAGGGVMFVPEKLERKGAVSYSEIVEENKRAKIPMKLFGKRSAAKKPAKKVA